jgi:hypothetical protein
MEIFFASLIDFLFSKNWIVLFNVTTVHYGPGFDSACYRNEYQEYFLGVKAAGA